MRILPSPRRELVEPVYEISLSPAYRGGGRSGMVDYKDAPAATGQIQRNTALDSRPGRWTRDRGRSHQICITGGIVGLSVIEQLLLDGIENRLAATDPELIGSF